MVHGAVGMLAMHVRGCRVASRQSLAALGRGPGGRGEGVPQGLVVSRPLVLVGGVRSVDDVLDGVDGGAGEVGQADRCEVADGQSLWGHLVVQCVGNGQ